MLVLLALAICRNEGLAKWRIGFGCDAGFDSNVLRDLGYLAVIFLIVLCVVDKLIALSFWGPQKVICII